MTVLEAEVAHRETPRRTRLFSRAGFPVRKTLADDDRHRVTRPSPLTWADLETGAERLTVHHVVGPSRMPKREQLARLHDSAPSPFASPYE